jgi:hypothetical protein
VKKKIYICLTRKRKRAGERARTARPSTHENPHIYTHTHTHTHTHTRTLDQSVTPSWRLRLLAKQVTEEKPGRLICPHQDVDVEVQRVQRCPQSPAHDDEKINAERERRRGPPTAKRMG